MKIYLGDGVYLEYYGPGSDAVLTTEDGYSATNRIVLEPEVLAQLLAVVRKLEKQ